MLYAAYVTNVVLLHFKKPWFVNEFFVFVLKTSTKTTNYFDSHDLQF